MAPYIRTVKTASGARAVQIVYFNRKGARDIEHIGSAHDDVELELLKTVARQKLAGGQDDLDLGLAPPPEAGGPLPVTASRMGHLGESDDKETATTDKSKVPDLAHSPFYHCGNWRPADYVGIS